MRRLSRREVLKRGAQGALLAAGGTGLFNALACRTAPPADRAVKGLAGQISGQVVTPDTATYADAKLLFNPQFNGAQPLAIVYCQTPEDVARAVGFATKHDLLPAARSGGHSFGGYSAPTDSLVIDVSRMNTIQVAADRSDVDVGPGALNVDLYTTLGPQGLLIPTGTCPTVGVAGLALGGGFGYSSRMFGLTADNLREVDIVLASGELVTASDGQNPALIWACRGGGGGNFGIVTSMRFRTHELPDVSVYTLTWAWRDAAAVIDAWQRWAPTMPEELFSTCNIARSGGQQPTGPTVGSAGQFFGSPQELAKLIAPLEDAAKPIKRTVQRSSFVEASHMWAGSDCVPEQCDSQAANPYKVKSQFFDGTIPADGVAAAVEALERWPGSAASNPMVGLELNSWGGTINDVGATQTAFVHRDATMLAILGSTWSTQDGTAKIDALHAWQDGLAATLLPHSNGQAYQNLIDPSLEDWQQAYYGGNYPQLERTKKEYDPTNVFRFAQSIGA